MMAMTLSTTSLKILWFSILTTLFLAASAMNSPNELSDCDVIVSLPDTTAFPYTEVRIPIFVDNFRDTVLGFALWIQTDRPGDVMAFQTDSTISTDTTYWRCVAGSPPSCTDSIAVPPESTWHFIHIDSYAVEIANFDTTGTLIAGWEYVNTRSFSGIGTDLLVVGIANLPGGPVQKGFGPQTGGTLIKLLADVFDDIDPFTDSTVQLFINKDISDCNFIAVSDPNWSPCIPDTFWDTNGFVCTQWLIDSTQNPPDTTVCLNWEQTRAPPWDSIVTTMNIQYVLDTTLVCINNGSVRILPPYICADLNGDSTAGNILDLNFLVNRIFRSGPQSVPPAAADVNCDGGNGNILDLNMIINRIFRSGPPLCNGQSCN